MKSFDTELKNRIASGSIKKAVFFGDNFDRPKPPYVVIKPIASGDRELYQFIVHVVPGMRDDLKKYILREIAELLKKPIEVGENRITARSTGAWLGPYVDESDNTLVMSRDFYIPIIL